MYKVEHKFPYKWNIYDGYPSNGIEYHGKKVFGTFICSGGSTMGYKPSNTLIENMSNASTASICHPLIPRKLNKFEACVLQSFPLDYNFMDQNPLSCIGRSVPPIMMAQISHQIYLQLLSHY